MKKIIRASLKYLAVVSALFLLSSQTFGASADDPLLTMLKIDQFEQARGEEESPLVLDGQAWIGHDLKKLWLKTDVERIDGETEEAELQFLYSQAVTAFWDFQLGVRTDLEPSPERNWAVVGWQGVAPYFLETDAALFVGESGRTALRLSAEYEMLFSQRLILTPEFELNFYGQEDPTLGIDSGLSDASLGLRLRYEIRREFAPYIGINWKSKFGGSADFARAAGDRVDDTQIVLGVRAWF